MQFTELNQNYKNSIMMWLVTLTFMVFLIIIIATTKSQVQQFISRHFANLAANYSFMNARTDGEI